MSESHTVSCNCAAAPTLLFPCSGGSDVGELTDRAARSLTVEGQGKMYCLAGIGGRVSGIMKSTEAADRILALDGCPLDCAKKTLEAAGFHNFLHLRMSDLGLAKGHSPANEGNITLVCEKANELMGR